MPAEHNLLLPRTSVSLLYLKAGGEKTVKPQLFPVGLDFYCFHNLVSSNCIVLHIPKLEQ